MISFVINFNNTKKMRSTLVEHLLPTLIIIQFVRGHMFSIRNCPSNCRCSWVLDSLEVDCSHRSLLEYPSFVNLPAEQLDLSSNQFQEFPSQLSTIGSLIYLDLSNNQIHQLKADALVEFTSLRILNLANNSFARWIDLSPNSVFSHAINLRHLSVSRNPLNTFTDEDESLLIVSQSLLELDVSYCDIKLVSGEKTLSGMPHLEKLNLSGNPLEEISSLPSQSLRVLEVSNCSLRTLSESFLDGLPSLEVLTVSFNAGINFSKMAGSTFGSHRLIEIDLSFCSLSSIDLSGFSSLIKVRLRGNMLRSIPDTFFARNFQIEILDMAQNSIHEISIDALSPLRRLTKLDLSYNEISKIDRNLFRSNNALVTINLSRNILSKITKFISNSLREINFSFCEILSIDSDALSGLPSVVKLDLSNNFLKEFPVGVRSGTLKSLDLTNCRLISIRNGTFNGFPELASLSLTGNRLTNPFPVEIFRSNYFLDEIWLGDNPWRCDCDDLVFVEFYEYLLEYKPIKLKDKNSVRCASPSKFYGRTWESACILLPPKRGTNVEKLWTLILVLLLILIGVLFVTSCLRKLIEDQAQQRNNREYQENLNEMIEIRRQNRRILERDAQPNAPAAIETNLPTYEAALLMPKLNRNSKSMMDLSSSRPRKSFSRSKNTGVDCDEGLVVDIHHRFRFLSEEMLSNRAKDRTENLALCRRLVQVERHQARSRRFSCEDSRFPPAHVKSQNLQSAEQIALFQSFENSPYSKRKPKNAPSFRRVVYERASIEFLTDSECQSKQGSPYAIRHPQEHDTIDAIETDSKLIPAVEDHFGDSDTKSKSSTTGSDFQIIVQSTNADISSLPDKSSSESDIESFFANPMPTKMSPL